MTIGIRIFLCKLIPQLGLLGLLVSGCSYRFTNIAMKPPPGVHSIAIEAVYDTSREVISPELLWSAIQAEFARNGRIALTSRREADALMTIHLNSAGVTPSGAPFPGGGTEDPIIEDRAILDNPYEYKNLKRAGNWTNAENVQFAITVKIHNLATGALIFKRSYNGTGNFRSVRAESVATPNTGYLLYDEALDTRTRTISEGLARRIVTDFLL